jgi:bacterioferritin-associated ferredoxin
VVCPGRLVCRCLGVTEAVLIEALVTLEIRTLQDLCRETGAGDGCTACHQLLRRYLEGQAYSSSSSSSAAPICSVR